MHPRKQPETMQAYRIGDPAGQFPVWTAEGSKRTAGRWHEAAPKWSTYRRRNMLPQSTLSGGRRPGFSARGTFATDW